MAPSDDLIDFVRDALMRGLSRGHVEEVLRRAGWDPEQVTEALAAFASVDFPIPVPRPRPSLSAREAFMYLLLFTTLYVVAFSLGDLIFQFIDRALPDPALMKSEDEVRDSIRWSISSLIVALPVFLYMSHLTSRATRLDPDKRTSRVWRWLTYLTLFVAACVLIGDLVCLVYKFIGGELTGRFALKLLTIAVIAGTVFWHYLADLRLAETEVEP